MSVRICGTCGNIPCRCEKGKCSKCGVLVNLDAIGIPLMDWNRNHNQVTGCTGLLIDPRVMEEMEEDLKRNLHFIQEMKKQGGKN